MHNGHIEGFASFKRAMVNLLTQEAYLNVTGVTDTEHAFALLLSQLRDPGRSSSFSREELEDALDELIRIVAKLQAAAGVTGGFTTLNLALSDGETLVATRYCDKWPETPPPSLYFCYDLNMNMNMQMCTRNMSNDRIVGLQHARRDSP